MAAIDKLYVNNYNEYNDIRTWAILYYPELLFYFFDYTLTYEDFCKIRKKCVWQTKKHIDNDCARIGEYKSLDEAADNIKKYYKETVGYDCPEQQALDEARYCINQKQKTLEDLEEDYTMPVMSTPLSVDKKLKWICPVPCVRKYLEKQCGVNKKKEWLYKLFWKGKKHFM